MLLSVDVIAGSKLLIEFKGESHRIVKVYETNTTRQLTVQKSRQVNNRTFQVEWYSEALGKNTRINILDPRIIRAPLAAGEHASHEAVLILNSGSYVVNIPDQVLPATITLTKPALNRISKAFSAQTLNTNIIELR